MTRNEFLSAVLQLITENSGPDGLLAARLGFLVRRAHQGFDWSVLGFTNLSSVLKALEADGRITIESSGKGALCVRLTTNGSEASRSPVTSAEALAQQTRLRKEIWNAFVLKVPLGLRCFDKESGSVVMGLSAAMQRPDSWVEIPPIPKDTQQEWARELLAEEGLASDEELQQALLKDRWFIGFTEALRKRAHDLWVSWNRKRTHRVVEYARDWAKLNSISFESLVDVRRRHAVQTGGLPALDDGALRGSLLAIIDRMTTQELLGIRVPLRCVVDVADVRGSAESREQER